MEKYIEGLITAYQRVLQLLSELDPERKSEEYNLVKDYIQIWLNGYCTELDMIKRHAEEDKKHKEFLQQCAFYDLIEKYDLDVSDCKIKLNSEVMTEISDKVKNYLSKLLLGQDSDC